VRRAGRVSRHCTLVHALYAWVPPSPRVRGCLLACFTYLLTSLSTLEVPRPRRSARPPSRRARRRFDAGRVDQDETAPPRPRRSRIPRPAAPAGIGPGPSRGVRPRQRGRVAVGSGISVIKLKKLHPPREHRAWRPVRLARDVTTGPCPLVAHGVSRHRPAPDYCNDHHTGPSHSIGPRAQHVIHIVHRAHCVHCVSGKGTQVLCIIAHIMPAIRVHIVLLCNRQGNASSLPYGSHVYPARERKFSCPYIVVYQPSSTSFVGVNGT